MHDDAHLAERAARGDQAALDALLEAHLGDLRAFVRLRIGPELRAREASSDLVQSVCREILQKGESFRHPGDAAFRRWLFTTALRKIADRADHWRAEKRDGGREEPWPTHGGDAELAPRYRAFSSPSQHAIAREELERVESAFEQLSEEQREVVTLAQVAGLSRAEIALHMGRSEGAVRVLLHRALARLTELLARPRPTE